MYQLPLKFIEVSPDVAICATRIVAIMSTKSYQARETIKAERKAGTLINGCGNRSCESCIFLDNGSVISSPYKISRLLKKIDKATEKSSKELNAKTCTRCASFEDDVPFSDIEYEQDDEEIQEDSEDDQYEADDELLDELVKETGKEF